jgi:hypothetical protein
VWKVAVGKSAATSRSIGQRRLCFDSHLKDVQEKLLGLKACDRTKTDTGRRDEKS